MNVEKVLFGLLAAFNRFAMVHIIRQLYHNTSLVASFPIAKFPHMLKTSRYSWATLQGIPAPESNPSKFFPHRNTTFSSVLYCKFNMGCWVGIASTPSEWCSPNLDMVEWGLGEFFHTLCWGAVGYGWGTSVNLGKTYAGLSRDLSTTSCN